MDTPRGAPPRHTIGIGGTGFIFKYIPNLLRLFVVTEEREEIILVLLFAGSCLHRLLLTLYT
jgi:hypothetical protein